MSRKKFWVFIFLIVFQNCQIERETPDQINSTYQPLRIGLFWVYQVIEKVYFGEGDVEEKAYYIRDRMVDLYLNEEGEEVYVLNRETSDDRIHWQIKMAYTYTFSRGRLIRQVENLITIPLVHPAEYQVHWDGNGMNSLTSEAFTITHTGPYALEHRNFVDTVKVTQSEDDDEVTFRDNRYEVFAANIGLIESYYEVLVYCSRSDCLGEQIVQNGRFIHLKLLTHGAE
ncbi:hypothetical protein [Pleomorphovibrio marinus]|uniref:hypothetical protein n=1 Tax=Pleomorphovibrio marinus TaxID=2164132 RepID=UPI000E0A7822|nr:hypothetical protein [Pleomorphovibrio marinus]